MEDGKNSRADICIFIISPAGRAVKKVGRWGGLKEVETNRHRAGLFLVFGLNKHTEHINSKGCPGPISRNAASSRRLFKAVSLSQRWCGGRGGPAPSPSSLCLHYSRGGGVGEGRGSRTVLSILRYTKERPFPSSCKIRLWSFFLLVPKLQTCILNRDVSSANMQSEK